MPFRYDGDVNDHPSRHSPVTREATLLLRKLNDGDDVAANALLPLVYEELRARAGEYFRGQPADHTLQPTALVHEAYVRLIRAPEGAWSGRAHFCAVAATAMRQILTDHARRRAVAQRARGERAHRTQIVTPSHNAVVDLIALDDALIRLAQRNAQHARLVELRFFGSLTIDEAADVLGVSPSHVDREWRLARAWLLLQLGGKDAP